MTIEYRPGYLAAHLDEGERIAFTRKAWKDGFFRGLHRVGPDLVERRIADVANVRPFGPFGGWSLLGSRRLTGVPMVEAERTLRLDELKEIVSKAMREDGFWRKAGTEQAVEQAIAEAQDFETLVGALDVL